MLLAIESMFRALAVYGLFIKLQRYIDSTFNDTPNIMRPMPFVYYIC